jgi:hypothetical protein
MGRSMRMRRSIFSVALVVAWTLAASAQAATIDVFSTGVDGTGSALAAGATDTHYTVNGGGAIVASNDPWVVTDTPTAQWIAPTVDQAFNNTYVAGTGDLPGTYTYETTFDLTGLDHTTAVIMGDYATDDGGEIWLNGVMVGPASTTHSSTTAFTIASGYLSGINTLQFIVVNADPGAVSWAGPNGENPTGLYVNITSTYARPIPEPNSLIFFGTGVLVVGMAIRKRATTT